jgi:hypothetical protein
LPKRFIRTRSSLSQSRTLEQSALISSQNKQEKDNEYR